MSYLDSQGWYLPEQRPPDPCDAGDETGTLLGVSAHKLMERAAERRVTVEQGGSPSGQVWRLTAVELRGAIVGTEIVSEDDLDRYLRLLDTPDFVWLMPAMIAV